ncbi:MAG: PpGpp synthetase/hydrolase Rel [Candidatus Uhrbacteria bacterium GW2011_GWD2_52_7]|uniref:PpGpp synthetase/hydrolase Rel n=1 Tax=Candidatus Uhrbacteria bacterium GW2011_GWD2_52_7 TaxID=1618989 RepID=A0A0G2AEA4_9BACT|nr:MAG: PpGpp synthetase/hydrolase Rel [Candidatus Uhrbacteria bacterium GW2011_GWD2_52_7]
MEVPAFQELKLALDERYTPADVELLERVYDFAKMAHEGQSRATGEPYFVHSFAVAMKLASLKLPSEVIASGLLHDVPEDTEHTLEEVEATFGADIAHMVGAITKLGHLKYRGEERYIENLRKMFVAMAEDVRVVFIKFADRMHNMETLYALPEHKRLRIAREVMEIYAPIANRLGMGEYRGLFEDYAFKYLEPKEYSWTKHLLEERVKKFGPALDRAMKAIGGELERNNIKLIDIHGRVKHCYSLFKKLAKYRNDMSKVYDIVAMRIIVKDISDCYAVLGILHGLYTPLPGRIKDYIAQPKPNGYQSLHTTVFDETGSILEFQIRTLAMHEESEYGVAAHWRYKEGATAAERNVKWMEELARIQKELSTSDFMAHLNELKLDMFHDRIFVFTPKGDVIDLPEDSTPIDLAYFIHSEIGNKASQARVNGEIAPLDRALKSGDMCEIIVDKNRKGPSGDWIKFVKTRHAREKIKDALRNQRGNILSALIRRVR